MAADALARNTHDAATLPELKSALANGGIVRIPWCGKPECESKLKEETGGKVLNVPLDQHGAKRPCVACGDDADSVANFGKSY